MDRDITQEVSSFNEFFEEWLKRQSRKPEITAPVIAYKGFDNDMRCNDFQFSIGGTFTTNCDKIPRLCSSDGFHYCKKLTDVFTWYPNDGKNRFCEIEVLGKTNSDNVKSVSTEIRIIRELDKEEIDKIEELEKLQKFYKSINLDKVKEFLTEYPMAHLAGSLSLLIHGCKLSRLETQATSDIDVVFPYFVEIPGSYENGEKYPNVEDYRSGSDFDFNTIWKGLKIDVVIDPKERYETIEFDGFKFKVNRLEDVLAAKLKYALQGNVKHRDDIYELVGKKLK